MKTTRHLAGIPNILILALLFLLWGGGQISHGPEAQSKVWLVLYYKLWTQVLGPSSAI